MSSAQGIDLERLSLADALDLAVLIEEEALERYVELAEQLEAHRTPEAASFFRAMAVNESRHRAQLLARRTILFPAGTSGRMTREMLFDVEAPDHDAVRAFMGLRPALDVALAAERKAHAFFAAALPRVTDPAVRALFADLLAEEAEHEQLVLREIEKLTPGDTAADDPGGPEHWVDEPAGNES